MWLIWPMAILVILCVIPFPSNIDTSRPVTILLFILVFLSTGLYEESLFRGVVLSTFLQKWGSTKKGLYFSVILNGLFFSLVHIPDLLKEGSFIYIAPYLIPCFFTGVFYAAYILRSKCMWIVMLFHGLGDIAQNLRVITIGNNAEFTRLTTISFNWEEFLITMLVTIPFFIYSLYILRKVQPVNESFVEYGLGSVSEGL